MPQNSLAFRTMQRNDLMINAHQLTTPSPSEYIGDVTKSLIAIPKEAGDKKPFGVNTKRF